MGAYIVTYPVILRHEKFVKSLTTEFLHLFVQKTNPDVSIIIIILQWLLVPYWIILIDDAWKCSCHEDISQEIWKNSSVAGNNTL